MSDEAPQEQQQRPDTDGPIDAKGAVTVLKNDTMNLLKKVDGGKPLTTEERDRFERLLDRRMLEEAQKGNALIASKATATVKERLTKTERDHLRNVRRLQVFELRCAGKTMKRIAVELGLSRDTVMKDCRFLDEQFAAKLDVRKATTLIQERLMELKTAKMIAMREARDARGANKAVFIATYLNIIDREIRLMQDVGVIPKTPIALEHSGPNGGPIPVPQQTPTVRLEDLNDDELAALERAAERIGGQRRN